MIETMYCKNLITDFIHRSFCSGVFIYSNKINTNEKK